MHIEDSIRGYLPQFFEHRKQDCLNLKTALEKNDYETVTRIGHSIKGVSRPFGFPDLETLGLKIEEAGLTKNNETIFSLLKSLENFVNEQDQKSNAET